MSMRASAADDCGAFVRIAPGAVSAQRDFGRAGCKKSKIADAAAKPLISLETAKENPWNSLEKAWKSLEFPWKSLDLPWKGLEKFGALIALVVGSV
jgi:hypothetical protein